MLSRHYKLLEALAETNRLRMLELFDDVDELTPTMISKFMDISAPLCTHHMQVLKRAGFISIHKAGRSKIVTRNLEPFDTLQNALFAITKQPSGANL